MDKRKIGFIGMAEGAKAELVPIIPSSRIKEEVPEVQGEDSQWSVRDRVINTSFEEIFGTKTDKEALAKLDQS